jgi:uncharacterized protein (DUF2062 family)
MIIFHKHTKVEKNKITSCLYVFFLLHCLLMYVIFIFTYLLGIILLRLKIYATMNFDYIFFNV